MEFPLKICNFENDPIKSPARYTKQISGEMLLKSDY